MLETKELPVSSLGEGPNQSIGRRVTPNHVKGVKGYVLGEGNLFMALVLTMLEIEGRRRICIIIYEEGAKCYFGCDIRIQRVPISGKAILVCWDWSSFNLIPIYLKNTTQLGHWYTSATYIF